MDFSGAVGGPFVVLWHAESTTVTVEEPLTLTLHVIGPGNLREMPRPPLDNMESFKTFAVENLDDRFIDGSSPSREFRYRVRPRTVDVKEIPRFKFVYFNPHVVPPSRGYQTTYAEAVLLMVKPRNVPNPVPAEFPDWMRESPTTEELFGRAPTLIEVWLHWVRKRMGLARVSQEGAAPAVALLVIPPLLSFVVWAFWRRAYPAAAGLAVARRGRAAATAIKALRRAGGSVEVVQAAIIRYLHDRIGTSSAANTPAELLSELTAAKALPSLRVATVTIMNRCDAVRFSSAGRDDPRLADDATELILEWEAAECSSARC